MNRRTCILLDTTSTESPVKNLANTVKYCEDTRPQNQLNAAKEQHKDLCTILQ